MPHGSRERQGRAVVRAVAAVLGLLSTGGGDIADAAQVQLGTGPADYAQPGTQPALALDNVLPASLCRSCHGGYLAGDEEPHDSWVASMMAQAARDPVWRAAVTIANGDAAGAGETCIRCHAPLGWLATRSTGGDPGALRAGDFDGVNCHFCHRMVGPILGAGSPAEDVAILAALAADVRPNGTCAGNPTQPCTTDAGCVSGRCRVDAGQGRFVVDPGDSRRGPFADVGFIAHPTTFSPFTRSSEACAPCHDVSTATYTRDGDAYVLNALGAAHPTQRPRDMFPEQRTFSEWRASAFADGGVVFPDGRFGGRLTAILPNTVPVSTCQDCHMPDAEVAGCDVSPSRPDMPAHFFAGANTWVLGAVLDEFGAESGLTAAAVQAAGARTEAMLRAASDLELAQHGRVLTVRVVNQTGHKLPTGYPEGRRMWINVRFFDGSSPLLLFEDGGYDFDTAQLDLAGTTRVYEARHEIDEAAGAVVGLPAGTRFHLALSNRIAFDDRIPPRGFTNAAFAEAGIAPVAHVYPDGQHWDDTPYAVPADARRVEATLYYQTTTREYADFLRATAGDGDGENAYARWLAGGMSRPVEMDRVALELTPRCEPSGACPDDGDPCTGERCDALGACVHTPVSCPDDGDQCTEDRCDPTSGACGVPRDGPCDDGDACTVADVCSAGVCRGLARSCDDGDACTADTCDPAAGCRHEGPGFAAVAAAFVGQSCTASRLSRRLERPLAAARKLVLRAERARRRARAKANLERAIGRLEHGERAVERSGPRVAPECKAALLGRFARARAATACLTAAL
jgi:hypothetical protein